MERKTGSGYSRVGKFPTGRDGHQFAAVNDREGNLSDSGRKIPSNAELKTRLGETDKLSNDRRIGKSETEKQLRDSRVSSSQRIETGGICLPEKEKGRTHPTENSDTGRPSTRSKIKIGGNHSLRDVKNDGEEVKRGMNPVENIKILTEKLQEENFFEELIEPRPMIVFNHVSTEEKPEKVTLQEIRVDSRSASPMLEVPAAKSLEKIIATRPPL